MFVVHPTLEIQHLQEMGNRIADTLQMATATKSRQAA